MADSLDSAEFLGVQVQEIAGTLALVAHHLGLGIQGSQSAQPVAAQDGSHGRAGEAQLASYGHGHQALATQVEDPALQVGPRALGASDRAAATVLQASLSAGQVAQDPAPCGRYDEASLGVLLFMGVVKKPHDPGELRVDQTT